MAKLLDLSPLGVPRATRGELRAYPAPRGVSVVKFLRLPEQLFFLCAPLCPLWFITRFFFFFAFFLSLTGLAQDWERVAPKTPPETEILTKPPAPPPFPEGSGDLLLDRLDGLILISSEEQLQKEAPKVSGVEIKGVPLLEGPEAAERRDRLIGKLQPFFSQPVSIQSLNTLCSEIITFYRAHDHPVLSVYAPPQDISSGAIQVVVKEGTLGKITSKGNRWFDSKLLEKSIRFQESVQLRPGDVITEEKLLKDINRLNSNPFRSVEVAFARGEQPGEVDIILDTKDRFPVRFFVGAEDSGSDTSGDERLLTGFNWGNPFGWDHQLNYQFMGEKRFNKTIAHSGSYLVPLPWGDRVTVFGFYQQSKADTDLFPTLDIRSEQWQTSARYNLTLPGPKNYSHELVFGFDFKQSHNSLMNAGVWISSHTIEVVQWNLGYNSGLRDALGMTSFGGNLYYSPGDLTQYNDDRHFKAAQETAGLRTINSQFYGANYYYARLNAERTTRLPWDFSWIVKGTYQISPMSNLPVTEQLGFGGWQSIRGYDERLVNGDEGYIVTTEVRTPPLSFGRWAGSADVVDRLQFIGFIDYGSAQQHLLVIGQDPNVEMWGVGPGVRYSINSYLTVRADYGFQIKDVIDSGFPSRRNSRWHLGVVIAY
ncbi:MAG: ShlB/FhaC/HecB family hemolysin secretion/activation protein [Verrucomicrobia bacterium]|nr:ShlB/FhaC/HecB family hemolysin secretion/activation protein [Verrucomicrobiota bacterium]